MPCGVLDIDDTTHTLTRVHTHTRHARLFIELGAPGQVDPPAH